MGLHWEDVSLPEMPKNNQHGIILPGDPGAWSKAVPLLWRSQNNWVKLHVEFSEKYPLSDGYYFYYSSGGRVQCYKKKLNTRYVELRIGPQEVYFWATHVLGCLGKLVAVQGGSLGLFRGELSADQYNLQTPPCGGKSKRI